MAGLTAPPGLPDVATLARLAGEFFNALPGTSVPGTTALTAFAPPVAASEPQGTIPGGGASAALPAGSSRQGLPAVDPGVLSLGGPPDPQGQLATAPGRAPHSASTNGLPDQVATTAPAAGGRGGGAALGVPEAYAAALPSVSTPSIPASAGQTPGPSSPYYFLGESSAYSLPPDADPTLPNGSHDFITAQAHGLPGSGQLTALLDQLARARTPEPKAPAAPGDSHFYFIDPATSSDHRSGGGLAGTGRDPHPAFDVNAVRRDFPILSERVNGRPLIWFDNAATTQKPRAVIDRLSYFYEHENSNIHRAAHELAARATDAYEAARSKVARFLGASSPEEIIFVRGATEAINLVAQSWGRKNIGAGDEIIVSHLEHHANIVPWQQLAAEKGAKLRVIPVDSTGQVLLGEYSRLLNERTKLVAVTQVSNALGTVVPVQEIVAMAHRAGACALVDGAQSVSHMRVNVQALDADFFVFSGHKIFGPTGIGVVYGKRAVLAETPPWQGGGNMIADVTFERTLFQAPPSRFEAGTGNIADAVGLGAALDYVERIGIENIARYEHDLLEYATHGLETVPGLHLIGCARDRASVLSFVLDGHEPTEVGKALNQEGIAVRSGHHCAQPILRRFGQEATVRASLAFYNTCAEVDTMVRVLQRLAAG